MRHLVSWDLVCRPSQLECWGSWIWKSSIKLFYVNCCGTGSLNYIWFGQNFFMTHTRTIVIRWFMPLTTSGSLFGGACGKSEIIVSPVSHLMWLSNWLASDTSDGLMGDLKFKFLCIFEICVAKDILVREPDFSQGIQGFFFTRSSLGQRYPATVASPTWHHTLQPPIRGIFWSVLLVMGKQGCLFYQLYLLNQLGLWRWNWFIKPYLIWTKLLHESDLDCSN